MKVFAKGFLPLILCCSCVPIEHISYENEKPPISFPPLGWMPLSERVFKKKREFDVCSTLDSCIVSIQKAFYGTWNRPPSAQNGMRSEFLVSLNEDYEVVEMRLAKPSGHFAFDRSAAEAIIASSPYLELSGLSINDFNSHFRRLRLVFEPVDLPK